MWGNNWSNFSLPTPKRSFEFLLIKGRVAPRWKFSVTQMKVSDVAISQRTVPIWGLEDPYDTSWEWSSDGRYLIRRLSFSWWGCHSSHRQTFPFPPRGGCPWAARFEHCGAPESRGHTALSEPRTCLGRFFVLVSGHVTTDRASLTSLKSWPSQHCLI